MMLRRSCTTTLWAPKASPCSVPAMITVSRLNWTASITVWL